MIALDSIHGMQPGNSAPPRRVLPSLREGGEGGPESGDRGLSKYKIGLWVFLGVATVLFAISLSAYFARMELTDWQPLQEPGLLWGNTVVLVLASAAMQFAVSVRSTVEGVRRNGFWIGGALAVLFLVGQALAWQQVQVEGYRWTNNPADSFFFLLTALHGLHVLGGLVAWVRTVRTVRRVAHGADVRLSMELCAWYWHFLLLVWLILFGVMLAT